jgi:putative membrane protein
MTTTTQRALAFGGGLLLILALSAAVAEGQTSGAPTSGASYVPPNDSISGQSMLDQLIRAHREEIRLSRSTANATRNADVRRFAQQMTDEHTAALNAAIALSDRLGYLRGDTVTTLSSTMTPPDSGMGGGLSGLADASADQAYVSAMISAHEAVLALLKQRSAKVTDPTVRAMAMETQGAVERHLVEAKRLQTAPPPATGQ